MLGDLSKYSTTAEDGAVLSKVTHEKLGKNEVMITIEAFQVKAKVDGRDEL